MAATVFATDYYMSYQVVRNSTKTQNFACYHFHLIWLCHTTLAIENIILFIVLIQPFTKSCQITLVVRYCFVFTTDDQLFQNGPKFGRINFSCANGRKVGAYLHRFS